MKDIVITSKTIKREILVYLGCFIFAFCLNLGAIIHYKHPAVELFTQIGYVVVISIVVFILVCALRVLLFLLKSLFKKR